MGFFFVSDFGLIIAAKENINVELDFFPEFIGVELSLSYT